MNEFSLIQQYFTSATEQRDDVLLGIGDDCALLQPLPQQSIAVTTDTLVEGVHFFADVCPERLGHKSLAVSLSDLAAMGATPAWFTLALTLPEVNQSWLSRFSKGLADLASEHQISLVGGDTTRGPLTITIQAHGYVDHKTALRRTGAKSGDLIYVTGTLGDAGAALALQSGQLEQVEFTQDDIAQLALRLERPQPRVDIGQQLLGVATAAIDISDGLLADLGHILSQSHVGARLDLTQLPLSHALSKLKAKSAQQFALQAGDDYELCFIVPPQHYAEIETKLAGKVTKIGMITDDKGINYINEQDQLVELVVDGYEHFKI